MTVTSPWEHAARIFETGGGRPWHEQARPKQLPPDHPLHLCDDPYCGRTEGADWLYWLLMSGRGFGKTLSGSNWLAEQALATASSEWAVIAPTFRDVRKTCIEASTGLLAAFQEGELLNYRRNELQLELANGSVIYGYSADQPERIRGANLHGAWLEELCSWRYEETWHEGLIPALRKGERPRVCITTTPRPIKLIKYLIYTLAKEDPGSVHITRGSTWENRENLSAIALQGLEKRYSGTRLGRQELEGELLEDVEGALWRRAYIDDHRITPRQLEQVRLIRVVVAMDPSVSSNPNSDEYGIVVTARDDHGEGYVLGDYSRRDSPNACIKRAVAAARRHEADLIVGEINNGGDFIESLLRTVDKTIPYKQVRASRGKVIRAEPASSMYEQGRVHHLGAFPELEDQLTTWTPLDPESPDRLDALVWGLTELFNLGGDDWVSAYAYVTCSGCGRMLVPVEGRTRCPHCRAELDQPKEAAA